MDLFYSNQLRSNGEGQRLPTSDVEYRASALQSICSQMNLLQRQSEKSCRRCSTPTRTWHIGDIHLHNIRHAYFPHIPMPHCQYPNILLSRDSPCHFACADRTSGFYHRKWYTEPNQ